MPKKTSSKKYRCMISFTFFKGERITMGQEIEVTTGDLKNKGLKAKLKRAFQPVGKVVVESEPIKVLDKE